MIMRAWFQSQTTDSRMKLLRHERLMRTYMTREKLNKCSPVIPDTENGTLIHCAWDCPKLVAVWKNGCLHSE